MKASHTIRPVFDDPNVVSTGGMVPALRLAESAGLYDLLEAGLTVPSPNAGIKTAGVIGGMLAGADSIDDLDVLRHGGMGRLFAGVRAPSTYGTFLRTFTHGHVQQLDAIGSRLLAGLAQRVPGLLAGARTGEGITFLDVDDTIRQVHGYAKQGAGFGYSGVRGLNIQLATLTTPTAAPVIARARLRARNTGSARGAGRREAQAMTTATAAGVAGQVMGRADAAYFGWALVGAALRHGAWFSVTARMNKKVTATIAAIPDDAWPPINYPHAIWEETEQRWVSDAEVAEVPFVAFTSRRKSQHVTCRLIVRRVKRLQPRASDGTEQGELFTTYRYHAFITNSTLGLVQADEYHREHAIVDQVIAELKDGPLAHLPSGRYAANAAWVAMAVIAFNLARATAVAADMKAARWATLRRKIINVPARIATTGRRIILHLPQAWPWADNWEMVHTLATGPPPAVTA